MHCKEIKKKLNAWVDNEVSPSESKKIGLHLKQCPDCCKESEIFKKTNTHLDRLPDIRKPALLSRKTLKAFRKEIPRPGFIEWWQTLSTSKRSAVCGVVLTGMLCGAVLCNSIITKELSAPSDPYQTLYAYKGVL